MGVKVREKVKDSGIWWLFINHKGKRASRQIGTRKAAEKVKEQIEARLKLGQDALPKEKASVQTLGEYWEGFEATYLTAGVTEGTVHSYRKTFRNHVLPALGSIRLDELTRDKVKAFVASLTQKRYTRTVKVETRDAIGNVRIESKQMERPLAKASIHIIVAELTAVLNHAKEDGIITVNPSGRLGRLYKQAPVLHEEIQRLTHQEVPIFLDASQRYFPEYSALFLAAIHTGMRSGKLAALKWEDVDFFNKLVIVRRTLSLGKVKRTKTDKIRRVDMSDELMAELQSMKRRRQAEYLSNGQNEIPEWVFLSREGCQIDMGNVKTRHFFRCLDKAGIRRIRFHDLRHTFASLLIQNGESLAYVKDQLGHSSIKMTVDVYGHLVPGANRAAVNRLPGLRNNNQGGMACPLDAP